MTLARLHDEMSSTEFEMRLALEMVRQEECPNCGVSPHKEHWGSVEVVKAKCPHCGYDYKRIKRT